MIALALIRAAHFSSCAVAAGGYFYERLIDRSARSRALVRAGLIVALLSGVAWFALLAMEMTGLSLPDLLKISVLRRVLFHTRFGTVWQWRTAIFIALVCAESVSWIGARQIGLLLAMALLGSLAGAGHGWTGRAPLLHLTADVAHLVATAVWPAGLLPLAIGWRFAGERRWIFARRYSTAAFATVVVLTVTGLINSICLLPNIAALFETNYGRWLIAKVSLFGVLIVLGALNRRVFLPRRAGSLLIRSVAVELIVTLIIFGIVGVMGLLAPGSH